MTTTTPSADTFYVRFGWTPDGHRVYQVMTDREDLPEFVREFRRLDDAAQWALRHNQALDDLREYVRSHDGALPAEGSELLATAREFAVDVQEAAADVWADLEAERWARQCNRSITYGGKADPSIAICELDHGHDGPHEDGEIRWTGGGYVCGDPLPFHIV